MATTAPRPDGMFALEERRARFLQETLDAILEFTGATVGWIGLAEPGGGLCFPARRGTFPESWLTFQQGQASVWGFEVREGPTLLNDLPALPALGEPPLRNLLSCPLLRDDQPVGHIILANKAEGFLSHDSTALQTTAHLLSRHLQCFPTVASLGLSAPLLRLGLDRAHEGILVVDQAGTLLFANTTWSRWTGFPAEELIGRPIPFPFWVSHRELATLGGLAPALSKSSRSSDSTSSPETAAGQQSASYLPFRHRNHSLFWCQVETRMEEVDGQRVTLAFLRQLPAPTPATLEPASSAVSIQAVAESLPFAVVLTDARGQVLWANHALISEGQSADEVLGQPLGKLFAPASAAILEQLMGDTAGGQPQSRGGLVLQWANPERQAKDLVAYWQSVALPEAPGFLFAFADNWQEIWSPRGMVAPENRLRVEAGFLNEVSLALLLRQGSPVEFWDERWEQLTGILQQDLAGEPGELVLDWLFPRQRDREFVADLLHQPTRHGAQAVLEVGNAGRPLLCTFLPIQIGDQRSGAGHQDSTTGVQQGRWSQAPGTDAWLILATEPQAPVTEEATVQRFLRQLSRGLAHLLNNYLTLPIGLAELALDRSDLPADIASSFSQILDSCMRAGRLVAALQDLAADAPGDKQQLSLGAFVRDLLVEQAAAAPEPDYVLTVETRDEEALVEVNPRMLKVVLEHLLTNAVQAVTHQERRQIRIQVSAGDAEVRCEIQDTGPGLPVADWTAVLAPFYSTKGSFAREAGQSEVDALGLGLTVSQHLLALHGGRLELHSVRGEGTTAALVLPRAARAPAVRDLTREDISAGLSSPHVREREKLGVKEAGA